MPEHMLQRDTRRFRLSELHWNQYRLDRTHAARIEARIIKMQSKYYYQQQTPQMIHTNGNVIPVDQIVAKPVLFASALRILNEVPEPTFTNRNESSDREQENTITTLTRGMAAMVQREANQVFIARG